VCERKIECVCECVACVRGKESVCMSVCVLESKRVLASKTRPKELFKTRVTLCVQRSPRFIDKSFGLLLCVN
jgi:hypothetical protein